MATLNINRRINDNYYRYTMPKIQIKTQGSTTVLTNLDAIARKLDRSPIHILKFFGYKFSTSVTADEKKNLFAISGIRDREVLLNHLYKFIDHIVLCSECENPETILILQKQQNDEVYKKCSACGNLTPSKMRGEKITKYIAKDLLENGVVEADEHDEQTNETSIDEFGEEEGDDDDLSPNHPLIILVKNKATLNDPAIIEKIINILTEHSLTDRGSFFLAKNVFTENIRQEIHDYKNLFQQLCQNNRQAQLNLLSAFETIVINQSMMQTKVIEEILFNLYNEDIIDEDTFHFWYRNRLANHSVRKLAKGFIQWLKQADEENVD